MFVSERTQAALQELIIECFQCNRNADRMVSVIGVDMVCPKTSVLLHHHIAHYFPAVADTIGEKTLERYNISVKYGATQPPFEISGLSLKGIIAKFEEMCVDFQSMLMATIKIALENNDIHVYADLLDILEDYNEIVEQIILVRDKVDKYDDMMAFDHDIEEFWNLGE